MMIYDWPMNIGGKPNFTLNENLPAFIPITFEMTVFCVPFNGNYLFNKMWTISRITL